MAQDWYPKQLAALIPWHANFNVQAAATGTARGLSAAQVTQINVDNVNVAAIINYSGQVEAFAQAVTEFRDLVLEGPNGTALPPVPTVPAAFAFVGTPAVNLPSVEFRTRQYAAIIKAAPGYTAEIGEQYGIIGAGPAPAGVPGVTATALTASQVRLVIAKAGYDVLAVDSKRGVGTWEQIGISQTAEFIDSRPPLVAGQPELREYRCQGMLSNARVGALSDVATAVTVP